MPDVKKCKARHGTGLADLLHRDVARANALFRTHVVPITCRPVKEAGRKFYRATVAANEGGIVKSLGQPRLLISVVAGLDLQISTGADHPPTPVLDAGQILSMSQVTVRPTTQPSMTSPTLRSPTSAALSSE